MQGRPHPVPVKHNSPWWLLLFLALCSNICLPSKAISAEDWQALISSKKPSIRRIAQQNQKMFSFFIQQSLHGKGLADFETVSQRIHNNVTWKNSRGSNAYNEAYLRSYGFIKNLDLQGMPPIIMLIPYLESQWHSKQGKPEADYGYWQLVREVVEEIQALEHAPQSIRKAHPNKIRSSASLSTRAAQIHLRRYYFYFAKVASYPETDAWLFTMTSYNWGAGNVKRLLERVQAKGLRPNFSNFYHALYQAHQAAPEDLSLRAATEYVPSLWNIAQLLEELN